MLLLRLWNHLVVILRRQHKGGADNTGCVEKKDNPADSAEDPGLVEGPADEEAVVVLIQVDLQRWLAGIRPNKARPCFCGPPATYHQSHSNELRSRNKRQQASQHLPARLPRLPASNQYNQVRNQHRQLQHNREVHKEPRAPPH